MITVHLVRSTLVGSAALFAASALAVAAAPAASARPAPPDVTGAAAVAPPAPVVQQIAYGSPVWTFVLVALVAVVIAVAVTLVVARRRTPVVAVDRARNDARVPAGQR